MKKTRTQNAIFNSIISILVQILKIILAFANRSIFIYYLGIVYLGINGLFSSILSVLSLAELGIGTAIAVSLYKPLVENNIAKINAYMQMYKRIYTKIASIVLILGIVISFFLPYLASDIQITSEIYYIYFLFLANSVISYLFTYKRILLDADQKRYINVTTDFSIFVLGSIVQWGALFITKSYILFLVIMILMTIISNIIISVKVNKIYDFLSSDIIGEVTKIERNSFSKHVKGTFISKIAETIVMSTDNILMSIFIGVSTVGMYSNYNVILANIQSIIGQLISSISGSLGNLIHSEEGNEKAENILRKYQFITFLITLFSSLGILLFSNIFITIWLGKEYLFSVNIIFIITLNFFITVYRMPFLTFINSYGLFWEQKTKNIVEAILNMVFSLGLLIYSDLGIMAILIGTILSSIFTVVWYEPYSVYKFGLKRSSKSVFKVIVMHYCYALTVLILTYLLITKFLVVESILIQIIYYIIFYILLFVLTISVFWKTTEFIFVRELLNRMLAKFANKFRKQN